MRRSFSLVAAQFATEDPVVALDAALQFEDTRESMQAFCVGQYMEVRSRPAPASPGVCIGLDITRLGDIRI